MSNPWRLYLRQKSPKMRNCWPGATSPSITTKGAMMAPTLARAEARPSAELRMVVAKTSLEIMYTTW